jgi:hypothetical protein
MAKKKSPRIKTEGRWDRDDRFIYFLASGPSTLKWTGRSTRAVLVAVNELRTAEDMNVVRDLLDQDVQIMLDSGVYSLAMETAKRRELSHDEALRMPLHEIDGFDDLYNRYLELVDDLGSRVWGYVELDLGGRDQKIETRMGLERMGLKPIPVYHPLNDGWEYFDELAARYDRICVGNLVRAPRFIRKRILATVSIRAKQYPGLWIHALGVTPTELLNAYPVESGDSSSWLNTVRWSGWVARTDLRSVGHLHKNFQYSLRDRSEWIRGIQMGAYGSSMIETNWRQHMAAMANLWSSGKSKKGSSARRRS